jgi:hypothetical protein
MMATSIADDGTIIRTEMELADIRDNIAYEVALELDVIWQEIKEMAIALCPKETGALASSITLENQGGTGAISVQGGDFYQSSIFAGSEDIVNPISGKTTAEYALFVHDGHAMPNGGFYEGVPFLADAVAAYENELESCVDKAMTENGWNIQ